MQFLGAYLNLTSYWHPLLPPPSPNPYCSVNFEKKGKLSHLTFYPYNFHLFSEHGSIKIQCSDEHLLNSFSSVQIYVSWFALPQAIMSSLISEKNSLVPIDQSRNTPWKSWCSWNSWCTGCLPDLSLWSRAGSISRDCGSSFPACGANLMLRGLMQIFTSCRRSKGPVSLNVAAAAGEAAVWVPAKAGVRQRCSGAHKYLTPIW